MSRCPSREQLQQLLAEQLSEAEQQAVETHVQACAACQETLARLSEEGAELDAQRFAASPPAPVAASDLDFVRQLQENPPPVESRPSLPPEGSPVAAITFPGPATEKGPLGQLDGFAIRKVLGAGRFGIVYEAADELNRLVSIKVLKPEFAASAKERARFEHEARTAAAVKHDHIVTLHQVGHTPSFPLPYLVMEYVEGETLSARLEREGLVEAKEAARIVQQLALALAAAHARGLVHRDIKPSNVLLEAATGRAKLTDFGLARLAEVAGVSTSYSGRIVGTPAYMSPEQIIAPGRIDGRSDIYSLGVVLYELLTGARPFRGAAHLLLQQVVNDEPSSPRQVNGAVPRDLETICLKCLQKESRKRYPSALALADDLQRFLSDKPVMAHRTGLLERTWRWCRRNRAVAALAASVFLLLVAITLLASLSALWLRQERDTALLNLQRAETHFRTARDALETEAKWRQQTREALDLLSSQVIEEWLARQKVLLPEHRKFLEQAVQSYEKLATDTRKDESSRAGVARAYLRVGDIRQTLGQAVKAEAAYLRSRELYQQLAQEFPAVPGYRQDLAGSHNNLGILQHELGKKAEAETAFRDVLNIRAQLAQEFPAVPGYRRDLAGSHNNLGNLLHELGKRAEAERAFRDALKIQAQLAQDFPAVPQYRQSLAGSHNNLGNLLCDLGKRAEAETAYQEALKIQAQLAQGFVAMPQYRRDLARSHHNLGNLLRDLGKRTEAESAYREAVKMQAQLAQDFPAVPEYREDVARSHNNLGALLYGLGRRAEAETAYHEALNIRAQLAQEFPTVPDYRYGLAGTMVNLAILLRKSKELDRARRLLEEAFPHHQAALNAYPYHPNYRQFLRNNRRMLLPILVELGEHAAAAETADQLIQAAVAPAGGDVYDAACFLARCVPLAERDSQLSETQRQERAQAYADRALVTLRQAIQNGYQDAAHMKKDTDLDPLRQRDDFRKLLAEVEEKAQRAGP